MLIDFIRKYTYKINANDIELYRNNLKGKYGLEIGGPSSIFNSDGILPVYSCIKGLDCCNFSGETIWQGHISEGMSFIYEGGMVGNQYIADVTDMSIIPDEKYDFVLCSHVIEHCANPLNAIAEIRRILKEHGSILLIVPYKDWMFDHNRRVTPFSHLLDDYNNLTKEDDLTHLEDILKFHDYKMGSRIVDLDSFRRRSMENYHNRALHQHVFSDETIMQSFNYFDFKVIKHNLLYPYHNIFLMTKI